jgi:hypothetical protein
MSFLKKLDNIKKNYDWKSLPLGNAILTLAGLPSIKCIPLPLNRFNNQIT